MMTSFTRQVFHFSSLSLNKWSDLHAIAMLVTVLLCVFFSSLKLLIFVAALSFLCLILSHLKLLTQYRVFAGLANWVTFSRLVITMLALINYSNIATQTLFTLMALALVLDVVDGFAARKLSQSSEFGRVFDMEADAFFVMALGLYFYFTTNLGSWLLLPGLMRYAYRLCVLLFPKTGFNESKKRYAATLAGVNFVILVAAIVLPSNIQTPALVISTCIVVFSFGISFIEYFGYADHH
ncbi:CDP-alcohol phosphatidyltransferase family protein [Agaribacter flavus]|uniref:CDP-alcohol phosphatidyltransferase family protein n=1 Tax=Agaribacter flavus TaxID=1902781 RepID=A0ABV7FQM1_9ALTE